MLKHLIHSLGFESVNETVAHQLAIKHVYVLSFNMKGVSSIIICVYNGCVKLTVEQAFNWGGGFRAHTACIVCRVVPVGGATSISPQTRTVSQLHMLVC